ncbi:MAG: FG-GAP-like repeat-containing protein [Bacteroidia bacterium]|nr:FG-GAP-like repeat-containing protein [Bacteroidia bacterium]
MNKYLLKKQVLVFFLFLITVNLWPQTFIDSGISLSGVDNSSVAWGDYDNDGYLDILITGSLMTKIYRNNGNNTFTEQTGISLPGINKGSIAWGDYDNDADLDILLTGATGYSPNYNPISKIYRNDGNNSFTEQTGMSLTGVYTSSVAWGDYDNDGYLDILLTGTSVSGPVSKIYRNNGNYNFTEETGISLTAISSSSVAWGDYDNDGDLDILMSGYSSTARVKIYRNNSDNTFTELTGLSLTSVSNCSAAWGDYDNDGYLDILLTGYANAPYFQTYSKIYRNIGNGIFIEQTSITLPGTQNGSVAWGDYDDDGDLDFLLIGSTSSYPISKIYRNNGNNSFTEETGVSLPAVTNSSGAWGDYDNDGDLDVLLTGQDANSNRISKIYINNCIKINKNPDQPKNLTSEIRNTTAILKWNKVTTDETCSKSITYNIRVGRKSGGSDFVSSQSASTGFRRIAAMGNNQLDTIFLFKDIRWDTLYYSSVQAIDNSFKGGAFSDEIQFSATPIQPSGLNAKYYSKSSLILKWKRGNGDRCILFAKEGTSGTASPQNYSTYFYNPVFAEGSPLGPTGWYCIYKGDADSVLVSGLNPQKNYIIQAIEFEGQNGSEIYAPTLSSKNMGVFTTALFSEQPGITIDNIWSSSVCWGDYDNDGYLDVLITGSTGLSPNYNDISKIYRNNGDRTFSEQTGNSLTGAGLGSAAWGDYDNDGDLDIILTGATGASPNYNPISKIYRNNGNYTFIEETGISLTAVSSSSVAWGDYDNDGYIDILLTGYDINNNRISKIYHNNGNGTFTEQPDISLTGVYLGSVAWGDYNSDGYLDILLTGNDINNKSISKIYRNNGDKTFTEQTGIYLTGVARSSVACGDYDNDSDLDILLAGNSDSGPVSKIYCNNGDNSFTEQTGILLAAVNYSSAAWGDYDNDGYLDILLTGTDFSGFYSKIYHNNSDNTFTEQTDFLLKGVRSGSVAWGDYDNNGTLDILLTGQDESANRITKIYNNNLITETGLNKPNNKPRAPNGLISIRTPGSIKLSWSEVMGDETSAHTISYNLRYKKQDLSGWKPAPNSADNGFRRIPAIGNMQLNNSFILKNISPGIYYWQVQAVDQGYAGGAWSAVDSFIVKNTQAFFKTDTVCQGLPTHFTDQSVATDGIASWKWDFKDGSYSTIQNPSHTFAASGIYDVQLIITSTVGDKDSLEQNVIVKARPITSYTAPNVCEGIVTTITNSTTVNGLTITSWLWDFGDNSQNATVKDPGTHIFSLKGAYQTKLKATANNGCADSITKEVIVAAIPNSAISVNGKTTFCKGDSVQLLVDHNPLYTYQWKLDNNDLVNSDTNLYVVKANSGAYSIKVSNSLANCISTSGQTNVTVNPIPVSPYISASGPIQFCQGDSVALSVTNTAGYTYQWKLNGGAVGSNSPQFVAKNSGNYNLVVSNANGCSVASTNSIDVTVHPLPSVSNISLSGPSIFCQGGSVTLSVPSTTGYNYNWRDEYGLISDESTNSYITDLSGTYQLEISNSSGCSVKTSSVNVVVKPSPYKPVIESVNYEAGNCPGENIIRLNASQNVPEYQYLWYKDGLPIQNETLSNLELFEQGNYKLEASLSGCKSESDIFSISFPEAPEKPMIYVQGPTVWYLACSNTTASKYKWYCNDRLLEGADKYYYVANRKMGDYRVSIANDKGCYTRSDIVTIPTGVTGINDIDPFKGLQIYPNPTPGIFTVEMDNNVFGDLLIKIITEDGKDILSIKFEKTTEHFSSQIDLSGQAKALYIINLLIDKYFATRKLVVE